MNIQLQPEGSQICSPCCVAMITGVPLVEIICTLGHVRTTRAKDLVNLLRAYGVSCAGRLKTTTSALPTKAILKLKGEGDLAHWVVYDQGEIYCSLEGRYPYDQLSEHYDGHGRVTSFLTINS